MSCVIRVSGSDIDVDAVLARLESAGTLEPYRVTRRGDEYRRGDSLRTASTTSLSFDVPTEEFARLSAQTNSICAFLKEHYVALSTLTCANGVQEAYVDVAIQLLNGAEYPVQDQSLKLELVKLLAELRLSFRLSLWCFNPVERPVHGADTNENNGWQSGSG